MIPGMWSGDWSRRYYRGVGGRMLSIFGGMGRVCLWSSRWRRDCVTSRSLRPPPDRSRRHPGGRCCNSLGVHNEGLRGVGCRFASLDRNRYRGSDSVVAGECGELGRQAAGADHGGRRICWPEFSVSTDSISLLWAWGKMRERKNAKIDYRL